ncbi:MAG: 50S ribosomal protein L6 [Chloroflexi bacterium]|jgi:large subunit ribosomal protein L6|nr:50S ribosomal protein L6 [Chloroflexota bacterium]MBT3669343.1 50S ribosomal protein L6 [Chloroflexota bacterium]MBT4003458.1 50S ribosomal protein L6 [Chloroflexota bacterium]MBT4306050.1 50S ribosomal protein L6 [Chloroflexota bacterium]MBT4532694.1 50S ribosomal protein L6 [Chloroflexota bacterium]
MSRIGRMPVVIPDGVSIEIKGTHVKVKGTKGELSHTFPAVVEIKKEEEGVVVTPKSDEKFSRAMYGTTRAVIQNMVTGVTDGFEKFLEIHGVGYRAEMKGKNIVLNVGYSHPIEMEPPEGTTFEVLERNNLIRVAGIDKQVVGQISAVIRKTRPPEPYKGKGIRYRDEFVKRKAGKSGAAA